MKTITAVLFAIFGIFFHPALFAFTATGFQNPFGVAVDPKTGYIYVSNVNGLPEAQDDNGFISRLKGDGTIDQLKFIDGASKEVTLNAPKGLVVFGNTLYVADVDKLHAFDSASGKFLFDVNFGNLPVGHFYDISVGPENFLYVVDSPGNVIYHIDVPKMHEVTTFVSGDTLGQPRSILWHPVKQFFIVSCGGSGQVQAYDKAGKRQFVPSIFLKGPGEMTVDDNGNVYLAAADLSAIYRIDANFALFAFLLGVNVPAGLGFNSATREVIITSYNTGAVQSVPMQK